MKTTPFEMEPPDRRDGAEWKDSATLSAQKQVFLTPKTVAIGTRGLLLRMPRAAETCRIGKFTDRLFFCIHRIRVWSGLPGEPF
jgi:hypothetical protein